MKLKQLFMTLPEKIKQYWLKTCLILLTLIIQSCGGKKTKTDFIGDYLIDQFVPVDSTMGTLEKINKSRNWVLTLKEKDNFELTATDKTIVGYWDIKKTSDDQYQLLLQGGGWTIFGAFDGTSMYFDKTYLMFDNLFSQVRFTKDN